MSDPVSSVAQAIRAIADAVKTAMDAVAGYKERRRVSKETSWASALDALATIKTLVAEHLETARIMTAPVRTSQDLASTAELLRQYVDTGSMPLAYDEVHGGLEQLIQSGKFNAEATALMRELRISLSKFQSEAFMVQYSSWAMADAVESVTHLVNLLESPDAGSGKTLGQINELRQLLKKPWRGHPSKNAWQLFRELPSGPPPDDDAQDDPVTTDEMISIVRTWFKDWFEHVQRTLYGGRGMYRLVGALEKMG